MTTGLFAAAEIYYKLGRVEAISELMKISEDLPFMYADKWTAEDSKAIERLFDEYKQRKGDKK